MMCGSAPFEANNFAGATGNAAGIVPLREMDHAQGSGWLMKVLEGNPSPTSSSGKYLAMRQGAVRC